MNNNMVKIAIVLVVAAVLAVCFKMYFTSLDEDFSNISRTETYRMGDHYTGFYHRPGCPKLKQTHGGGIRFESSAAAKAEGYSACDRCDPDGPNE